MESELTCAHTDKGNTPTRSSPTSQDTFLAHTTATSSSQGVELSHSTNQAARVSAIIASNVTSSSSLPSSKTGPMVSLREGKGSSTASIQNSQTQPAPTHQISKPPTSPSDTFQGDALDQENSLKNGLLLKFKFMISRSKHKEAIELCKDALVQFPNDITFLTQQSYCHRALGNLEEALQVCDSVLEIKPSDATAHTNKGIILKERRDFIKAIESFSRSLTLEPNFAPALQNLSQTFVDLGIDFKNQGKLTEALDKFHEAISIDPSLSPAYLYIANVYCECGEFSKALPLYLEAVRIDNRYIEALVGTATCYKATGELDLALQYFEKAYQLNPNIDSVKSNLAIVLTDIGTQTKLKGNLKQARILYKKALFYNPHYAHAYYNLGVAYGEQCKTEKAILNYHLATTFNPWFAEAYNNLGVVYKDKENLEKALLYYSKALEVNPNFSQSLNNMGVIFTVLGKMSEAYEYTKRAIDVNPTYAEAYNNLGVLYRDQGDLELSLKAYNRCIAIDPNSRNAFQNRLLVLNYFSEISLNALYKNAASWGTMYVSQRRPLREWKTKPRVDGSQPIRVGYIGPDFFTHSVSYFIHAPLLYHNREIVDVFVYANVMKGDDKTKMFQTLVSSNRWRNIVGLGEDEVCRMIVDDEIDILVELTGHTANNRLDVMAVRPAPIQVTWIGYPNTTGLQTIDYRLTDAIADPIDTAQQYTEQLCRLPDCFLCYRPYPDVLPQVNVTPCDNCGVITFGSFNNLAKLRLDVIKLWSRILHKVPNSRLLIKAKPFANAEMQQRYALLFKMEGIENDRLDLVSLIPACVDHLKTYGLVDIGLDTFPYAGTTTTCEALIMGVPVVTLKKHSNHAHNVGTSLLTAVNLTELIASTKDEYVDIAVKLAFDIPRLSRYRKTIRDQMLKSKLCDGETHTRNLEKAYRDMFRRWCAGDSRVNRNLDVALNETHSSAVEVQKMTGVDSVGLHDSGSSSNMVYNGKLISSNV